MEEKIKKYNDLFPEGMKAKASDKIAEKYYFGNFGTMSKSDFETLLFSIYIERILDKSEKDMSTYSDYTLSKQLGITQSKVSNLKVKKELQYPRKGFDWKVSFSRICNNAQFENGKIKIHIPDKNLYLEIKNRLENMGEYVDVRLNPALLQITPQAFISLVISIAPEKDKDLLVKEINKKYLADADIAQKMSKDKLFNTLKEFSTDIIREILITSGSNILTPKGEWICDVFNHISKIIK